MCRCLTHSASSWWSSADQRRRSRYERSRLQLEFFTCVAHLPALAASLSRLRPAPARLFAQRPTGARRQCLQVDVPRAITGWHAIGAEFSARCRSFNSTQVAIIEEQGSNSRVFARRIVQAVDGGHLARCKQTHKREALQIDQQVSTAYCSMAELYTTDLWCDSTHASISKFVCDAISISTTSRCLAATSRTPSPNASGCCRAH